MTETDESFGIGIAQLMSPELARSPQPTYAALREGSPVFRLDGVGVIVCTRAGVDEVLRNPDVFSSNMSAHDLKTKRPLMARAAESLADTVCITSDNPRTEDPQAILEEILTGFSQSAREKVIVEMDRRSAIERILADAQPNDIVLLAGKGHESSMITAAGKEPWDERAEAEAALREFL